MANFPKEIEIINTYVIAYDDIEESADVKIDIRELVGQLSDKEKVALLLAIAGETPTEEGEYDIIYALKKLLDILDNNSAGLLAIKQEL